MVLNFVGDVVLADLFETYGYGIGSKLTKRSFNPFKSCQLFLDQGDVNIVNLESVFSNFSSKKFPWSQIMRSNPASIDLLIKHGIHAVNLANNHTLDHGLEAFNEMVRLLDSAGIVHFGGPRDTFQEKPSTIICKEHKILILGYYIEESILHPDRELLINRIVKNIRTVKKENEILILSLHWGSEYSNKPFSWMIQTGKKFIDSGVDILYGHHSHTYQGVTIYKNGIFAPSLGNFIFEDCFIKNRRSTLLQVEYSEKGFNFKTIPLMIDKEGKPVPSERIKNYIESINYQLEDIIKSPLVENIEWNKDARIQVRYGHIKNRLKIRFRIFTHPVKFLSFIINR